MFPRTQALGPCLVAGVTGLSGLVTLSLVAGAGDGVSEFVDGHNAAGWLAGLVLGFVAALVLRDAPGNAIGPVLSAAGLTLSITALADGALRAGVVAGDLRDWASWIASWWWVPAIALVLLVPLLYPDGHTGSRPWHLLLYVSISAGVVTTIGCLSAPVDRDYRDAVNPLPVPVPEDSLLAAAAAGLAVMLLVAGAATLDLVLRMRRTTGAERARLAWFAAAIALLLSDFAIDSSWFGLLVELLAWVCLALGIVRHHLFDIETILSRSVAYALLTAGALLAYLGTAALIGSRLESGVLPAAAAAVVALVLSSARERVQHTVERLLYGERSDPLAALTRLGERLEGSVTPDEVLPAVVATVRESLRLPYVAVILEGDDHPAAESGAPTGELKAYKLEYGGVGVGVLAVALRRGERASPVDDTVLTVFARQTAAAAHAARVMRDLRRSRERIVLAREEERRRVRRDLHDQLGPTLAGIGLGLESAGRMAEREGFSAAPLLEQLSREAISSVEDVRRIVADLRPPVLDEVGLLTALERYADLVSSRSGMTVTVEGADLPSLPAAVELAAYRIVLESVNNAARHAQASTCRVKLAVHDGLRVTVSDDGSGRPPRRPGVGLTSITERAEELGGTCTVTSIAGTGTRVEACLP
jgi:two-component system NarL family sensor kinase